MNELINQAYKGYAKRYLQVYEKNFDEYPHQRIRFEIVQERLRHFTIKKILDVGCGSCFPLLRLLQTGYDVKGIDITEEMIKEGQKLLEQHNFSKDLIKLSDVFPISEKFDCIINLGAFPTCENDNLELRKYSEILNPGGKIFVEHRNELFALFTFNSYTYKLYEKLIPDMPDDVKEFLRKKLILKEPDHSASYYKASPRLHNPLIIQDLYEKNGFVVNAIHFYHYHWLPPIFEKNHKDYNKNSLGLEKPNSWRGVFQASAFVVEAQKI